MADEVDTAMELWRQMADRLESIDVTLEEMAQDKGLPGADDTVVDRLNQAVPPFNSAQSGAPGMEVDQQNAVQQGTDQTTLLNKIVEAIRSGWQSIAKALGVGGDGRAAQQGNPAAMQLSILQVQAERLTSILDVLQDANRGIWSLVQKAFAGSDMQPMMGDGFPHPSERPPPEPEEEKPEKGPGLWDRLKSFGGSLVQRTDDVIQKGSQGNESSSFGSAMQGIGQGAAALEIPVVGEVMLFAGILAESVDTIKNWNNQLLQSSFKFAEFSSAMAGVQARFEVAGIQRDILHGQAQSGSAGRLADSQSKLLDSMAPLEDAWANVKNEIMTTLTDWIVTPSVKEMVEIMKWMRSKWPGEDKIEGVPVSELQRWHFTPINDSQDRPPRFGGPAGGP